MEKIPLHFVQFVAIVVIIFHHIQQFRASQSRRSHSIASECGIAMCKQFDQARQQQQLIADQTTIVAAVHFVVFGRGSNRSTKFHNGQMEKQLNVVEGIKTNICV